MRNTSILTFTTAGVIMGLLITWQFRSNAPIEGSFPTDEVDARDELLNSLLDEQSYLQSRIVSLRGDIEEAQNDIELQTETVNLDLLDSLKKDIGLTEITGEGLEISLDDSNFYSSDNPEGEFLSSIQASDLRDIVNVLNAGSAEAIAINNQRIIASSTIISVGSTLLVNNSHIAPPFTISAVGDTDLMLQRLLDKNLLPSIYDKQTKSRIVFEVFKKNRLNIPIYNGDLQVNYLNLIEQ